jgi:uncharacterized protein with PIN domain
MQVKGGDQMEKELLSCIRCNQALRLLDEQPVTVNGQGELCPECYRNLRQEEYRQYF